MNFLVFSCSTPEEKVSDNPAFASYISAYTYGVIPSTSQIIVKVTEQVAENIDVEAEVDEGLLSFEPQLEGTATWVDPYTLVFTPQQKLPSAKSYTAYFNLGRVASVSNDLESFMFSFQTIAQGYRSYIDGIRAVDESSLIDQSLLGRVEFADVIKEEELEGFLVAKQSGRDLSVSFEGSGKSFSYTIDGVKRQEDESEVQLLFNGEQFDISNLEQTYIIPALNDFKVTNVKVTNFPKQKIEVWFSDPLKDQDLDGLIVIDQDESIRLDVSSNVVTIYPSSRLTGATQLRVLQGIENTLNYKLKKDDIRSISFEELKPEVQLLSDGAIMPSSNGLIIPFKAVNLKAVDVFVTEVFGDNMIQFFQQSNLGDNYLRYVDRVGRQVATKRIQLQMQTDQSLKDWNNFYVDLSDIIDVKSGSLYIVDIRFKKDYSLYNCGDVGEEAELQGMEFVTPSTQWEGFYDRDDYFEYSYNWRERDNPCHSAYYDRGRCSKKQNLMASDLGLMAKAGADKMLHIFTTDLINATPESGVIIELYDYQQQLLASGKTDGEGMLAVKLERQPFVVKALRGDDITYLELEPNLALSTNKFDVSGSYVRGGVKGLMYGERGVWRPGDTIFLTFVLEDVSDIIPANHPIVFELESPEGVLVDRQVKTMGVNGFYPFITSTSSDAPTGNYMARVEVGNRVFSRSLKVETVKPNRLKVDLDFGSNPILSEGSLHGSMDVRWLHGAKVSNTKAVVDMIVQRSSTRFDGYKEFTFDNHIKRFNRQELTIFDGQLDENGHTEIDPGLSFDGAPGFLRLSFNTKAFEPGGDFSVDYYNTIFSPFSHYAGVQVPKGDLWWGTLSTGKDHTFEFASVNEEGQPTENRKLQAKIYKLNWRWWWDQYDGDLANFTSSSSTKLVKTQELFSKKGKANLTFNVNKFNYGRYIVIIEDLESGHSASKIFYVDQPYYERSASRQTEFATMLTLSADKDKYEVGEKAEIRFPSSNEGRVLVSIENGTEILHKEWVETTKGETVFDLEITEGMAPNIYCHLTMIQPHDQTSNDRPIRLYGILPILVEDPNTKLEPVISTEEEWRPETIQKVCVREKNGKAMTYTIAVVDDGLLDLTRYRTPRIWSYFYAKEALGVRTWDMFDEVVGAYGAELMRALGIGGDDEEDEKENKNANRFKPMVRYLGPFTLEAGEDACHEINVPNYVGSVRVMVVAGDEKSVAYGSSDETIPVRNPLMVLGTLPRVAGPGEEIEVPVSVFASKDYIKSAEVVISTNEMFEVVGAKKAKVTFNRPGEELCRFKLKTPNKLGLATVRFDVSSGNEKAYYEVELDVRASNPMVNDIETVVLSPGESLEGAYDLDYIDGTNGLTVEVSSLPAIDLHKRLDYLIRYPHGCVEQTTSAAFPQLYLNDLTELDNDQKIAVDQFVDEALRSLVSFQLNEGGFGYWPGSRYVSDWGSTYAGHFMVEAERKGYQLPAGMNNRWIYYTKRAARSWNTTLNNRPYHLTYQAYRLYALALADEVMLSQMNALRSRTDLNDLSKWYLAGAYQLAGQPEAAEQLISGLPHKIASYRERAYTYGSHIRDEAVILQVLVSMNRREEAFEVAMRIAAALSDDVYMSTQTTAYALIGISNFIGDRASEDMSFNMDFDGRAQSYRSDHSFYSERFVKQAVQGKHTVKVTNTSQDELFVSVTQSGIPISDSRAPLSSNIQMEVHYEDKSGNRIDPTRISQGTDFKAVVYVYNNGSYGYLNELSLSQIFPSGWEVGNVRMMEGSESTTLTYQDIRDDRVYSYFDLSHNSSKTIEVPLTATYVGRYYLPLVLVEAMYDEELQARNSGIWVEVVKE